MPTTTACRLASVSTFWVLSYGVSKTPGDVAFPRTPDEWVTPEWYKLLIRTDPDLPWLPASVRRRIRDFETVMNSRWPTTQDLRLAPWGRTMLQSLGSWRYALGAYRFPAELRFAQKVVRLRQPRLESL